MSRCVRELLDTAAATLRGYVDAASLDAQVLLAHVLQRDRSWLFAWPEHIPGRLQVERYLDLVERRRMGHPVAYLIEHRAFWSLDLRVTPATLIPRPETEHLIEAVLELPLADDAEVLELGTGSGAIALALAHERPGWSITATDVSVAALEVARANAKRCARGEVDFRQGDWFAAVAERRRFSLIVSNPPYVAVDDPYLSRGDLRFEPDGALVAGEDGLRCLRHLIAESPSYLLPGGWIWLEHGATQGLDVRNQLSQCGFSAEQTRRDLAGLERCSGAQLSGR